MLAAHLRTLWATFSIRPFFTRTSLFRHYFAMNLPQPACVPRLRSGGSVTERPDLRRHEGKNEDEGGGGGNLLKALLEGGAVGAHLPGAVVRSGMGSRARGGLFQRGGSPAGGVPAGAERGAGRERGSQETPGHLRAGAGDGAQADRRHPAQGGSIGGTNRRL